MTSTVLFFVEGIAFYDSDLYAEDDHRNLQWGLELGQAWVHASNVLGSPFSLQSNEGRFDGVNYFHYYGELLRPELSNLHIWTVAVGFEFWRSSSVEFVYHVYHQVHPSPFVRDARLDIDPAGERRALGQEWDVVLGLQEWKHIDIELFGSLFRAGPAYGEFSGRTALSAFFEIDYNF